MRLLSTQWREVSGSRKPLKTWSRRKLTRDIVHSSASAIPNFIPLADLDGHAQSTFDPFTDELHRDRCFEGDA